MTIPATVPGISGLPRVRALLVLALALILCACAATTPTPAYHVPSGAQVPPFAKKPFEPLRREAVVAIALREWRLFGQPVDDEPPDTRPPPLPQDKPERQEGYWQRVAEYWWTGLDPNEKEAAWTGKHDEWGAVFPADQDGYYAWSAAFVSYVMRIAGAGDGFPYSKNHATYINIAKQMADGTTTGYVIRAQRPSAYAPQLGDLICTGRGPSANLKYDDLPTSASFPAHCDIVVKIDPGQLSVLGGNVDDAVTMKHIPVTPQGMLATPDGTVLDTRYPWMVVLQVLYPPSAPEIAETGRRTLTASSAP
ncbi:MAG TPA: DUF2272 domain-containing protein [Acidisphaera sp.]|nr:DUF2272 domain-containing protein [Acidisphaera sp.]